jgi:hypothetical protein
MTLMTTKHSRKVFHLLFAGLILAGVSTELGSVVLRRTDSMTTGRGAIPPSPLPAFLAQ